jgi:dethiobiotin synthetase
MRPQRVVVVVGTGTEVGKTWVSARLLTGLREAGVTVAARKPAQSFAAGDDPADRDAAVLGMATGEAPEVVCPPHRWYEAAMAPPMAAEVLGRPAFSVAELVGEVAWPAGGAVEVGLIETAGGARSPIACDGDCVALCQALQPDLVLLVADAGLGTINSVRLTVGVVPEDVIVILNRFDGSNEVHVRNRQWLSERDGLVVVALPGGEARLGALVRGSSA